MKGRSDSRFSEVFNFQRRPSDKKQFSESSSDNATLGCERWLITRIDNLRSCINFYQQNDSSPTQFPTKLARRHMDFDPDERNGRGETMIIATIKYISDATTQIRYLNMLMRAGCDPSASDLRSERTPLMYACIVRNFPVVQFLLQMKVDISKSDRLGNTALMYAAIYGQPSIVSLLVSTLTKQWSFDIFRAKNLMGYTAEELAKKNGHHTCSRLLLKERLQMLNKMHKQLALIHLSASLKGWTSYRTLYKAKQAFLSRKTGQKMRRKASSLTDDTSSDSLIVPFMVQNEREVSDSELYVNSHQDIHDVVRLRRPCIRRKQTYGPYGKMLLGLKKLNVQSDGDVQRNWHLPPLQAHIINDANDVKQIIDDFRSTNN